MILLLAPAAAQDQAGRIDWGAPVPIARTSVDEDIRTVLRDALRRVGLRAVFRGDVTETITKDFSNVPPEGVFNEIVERFDLDYRVTPETRIVTLFPAGFPDTSLSPPTSAAQTVPAAATTPVTSAAAPSTVSATADEGLDSGSASAPSAGAAVSVAPVLLAQAGNRSGTGDAQGISAPEPQAGTVRADPGPTTIAPTPVAVSSPSPTAAPARLASDIPWQDLQFNRNSFDEPIRDVFRILFRRNGTQVIFRPDVDGVISFNFEGLTLRDAFVKLIEEGGLDYAYDRQSNTVTLFKAASDERLEQIVALTNITVEDVLSTKTSLQIAGEIIAAPGGIIKVRGGPEEVQSLVRLVGTLETRAVAELKQRAEQRDAEVRRRAQSQDSESAAFARRAEADRQRRGQDARDREARLLQDTIDELQSTDFAVIPLRYATVGPTSQTFRGKPVSIPGIDETIRTLLGAGEEESRGPQDAEQAARLATARARLGLTPPTISIDTRTNSIIVRGNQRAIDRVRSLVRRLDRRVPLVEIEVMIVDAQKGVSADLGVRYGTDLPSTARGKAFGVGLNRGLASDQLVQAGRTANDSGTSGDTTVTDGNGNQTVTPERTAPAPLSPVTLLPTDPAGTVANVILRGTNLALQAEINDLSQDNRAQIISAPRVVTLNNLQARIANDGTQFVRTEAGANSSGSLEEINAGLTLQITPSVIEAEQSGQESLIRLVINATNTSVQVSGSGNADVTGTEVQTQVEIPDGATFMLGGLVNDLRTETKEGIPGLQDIPLLGNLFKNRSSSDELAETIFFITPRVVRSEERYAGISPSAATWIASGPSCPTCARICSRTANC